MIRVLVAVLIAGVTISKAASAQQAGGGNVWVQIEAHPSLSVAQNRAQLYSDALPDVGGFSLGGSWYGIVLGPYNRDDAQRVLEVYLAERQIPRDSFIAFSRSLGQQFWPPGAAGALPAVVPAPVTEETTEAAAAPLTIQPSDESRAEARQNERLLTADERKQLQIALQAAGFYNSTIDGAFGPGTRRSMSDWQFANGFETTGILTTLQRKTLMDQYNEPLISVGMRRFSDDQAGLTLDMPLDAIRFSRYEPPFAHFEAASDLGAQVLLISQPGDRATLYGLYDIMQTLEIVPLNGPRERRKNDFVLEGRGNGIVSYTEASLADGQIKGFTLIWPDGDEARRSRVLAAMKSSLSRDDAVLDPAAGTESEQRIDLVSGLHVRKPRLNRSGFFVDDEGTVVTVAEAVGNCTRITVDQAYQAEVVTADTSLGVAVLRPVQSLAPMAVAGLRPGEPRLQSKVTVSGFSYEGVLGAPTLTFGALEDLRGLRGETELTRLTMAAQDGDAGGPVFDTGGAVIGMLLPDPKTGQQLPRDVSFAADAQALRDLLDSAGLTAQEDDEHRTISPDELNRRANAMTVLVSCWD
ncbi:MAG: serine protease [Pseudomonadota bacterium]